MSAKKDFEKANQKCIDIRVKQKELREETETKKAKLESMLVNGETGTDKLAAEIQTDQLQLEACGKAETRLTVERRNAETKAKREKAETLADDVWKDFEKNGLPELHEAIKNSFMIHQRKTQCMIGGTDAKPLAPHEDKMTMVQVLSYAEIGAFVARRLEQRERAFIVEL